MVKKENEPGHHGLPLENQRQLKIPPGCKPDIGYRCRTVRSAEF